MLSKKCFLAAAAVLSLCVCTSAFAAPLDNASNAIVQGSSPYSNLNLFGTIEYAVFTASDFSAEFPGSGYAPTDPVVYVYQIDNLGPDAVSFQLVGLSQPASGIGSADIDTGSAGFISPANSFFDLGGNANWSFIGNEIPQFGSSQGLVFSSKYLPEVTGTSITVNGGTTAVTFPIAVPGSVQIPEPSTIVISGFSLLSLVAPRRRR